MAKLTQAKAGKILKHGKVKGHRLSAAQKRFFGAVRGGATPRTETLRRALATKPRRKR